MPKKDSVSKLSVGSLLRVRHQNKGKHLSFVDILIEVRDITERTEWNGLGKKVSKVFLLKNHKMGTEPTYVAYMLEGILESKTVKNLRVDGQFKIVKI